MPMDIFALFWLGLRNVIVKSSQVTFIYIALLTIQIVPKQLYSIKLENKINYISHPLMITVIIVTSTPGK